MLRQPIGSALRAVVAVNYDAFCFAVLDRHSQGIDDQVGGLGRVDRPADHPPGGRIEHDGAVDLAFPGRVLGDVGQPQPVRLGPGEVPVDEILGGWCVRDLAVLGPARQACQSEAPHHQLHRAAGHDRLAAQHQLGVNPAGPVGLAGLGVYLADHLSDHGVTDRPSRRLATPPHVEPRHRHPHHSAGDLDGEAFAD